MVKPGQVVEGVGYNVQPKDIDISGRFPLLSTFGHRETELAAIFIISFCQQKGGWVAFTYRELDEAYAQTQEGKWKMKFDMGYRLAVEKYGLYHLFDFYDLVPNLVVLGDDGKYRVTEEFIRRCHKTSGGKQ